MEARYHTYQSGVELKESPRKWVRNNMLLLGYRRSESEEWGVGCGWTWWVGLRCHLFHRGDSNLDVGVRKYLQEKRRSFVREEMRFEDNERNCDWGTWRCELILKEPEGRECWCIRCCCTLAQSGEENVLELSAFLSLHSEKYFDWQE